MATVSLTIYTSAYPSITNDIEIRIYKQTAPLAVIDSHRYNGPTHGPHVWAFPGLERTNYVFKIFEMVGSVIVQQLGDDTYVVPNEISDSECKATEQIQADVTTGFISGVNSFVFDGTGGTMDWRGWDIGTAERIGSGPLKKNVDYSWIPATGAFALLMGGDIFNPNEWVNVEFDCKDIPQTGSVPPTYPPFKTPKLITANYSASAGADMGGLLIIDPAANYIEITLPDIATVPYDKPLDIEIRKSNIAKCTKILTFGGQKIDWLKGGRTNMYAYQLESISFYRWLDPVGPTDVWRVFRPFGQFLSVGEKRYDDAEPNDVFNKMLADGAICDILQYARLYNDYVLQLPPAQLVNYDDWATGTNKYFYSLANSSNPANAGKFRIPDRRGIFKINSDGTRVPGNYAAAVVAAHTHPGLGKIKTGAHSAASSALAGQEVRPLVNTLASGGPTGVGATATMLLEVMANGGSAENNPANIAENEYILF